MAVYSVHINSAAYIAVMPVLLVMDTRGGGLQDQFDTAAPGVVKVVKKGGADISTLLKLANRVAVREKGKYNVIIIAGGICSITKLNRARKVKLRFKTTSKLIDDVSEKLKVGLGLLRLEYPRSRVIVTPNVGMDIGRYNGAKPKNKVQRKLNRMVTAMNKLLIDSNSQGSKVPWISKKVHACKSHHAWSHKYKHLSDGCHFNAAMKKCCRTGNL